MHDSPYSLPTYSLTAWVVTPQQYDPHPNAASAGRPVGLGRAQGPAGV